MPTRVRKRRAKMQTDHLYLDLVNQAFSIMSMLNSRLTKFFSLQIYLMRHLKWCCLCFSTSKYYFEYLAYFKDKNLLIAIIVEKNVNIYIILTIIFLSFSLFTVYGVVGGKEENRNQTTTISFFSQMSFIVLSMSTEQPKYSIKRFIINNYYFLTGFLVSKKCGWFQTDMILPLSNLPMKCNQQQLKKLSKALK